MKAFVDIETGGFSITKNGICEIAIIVVDKQFRIVDMCHVLIKPYAREGSNELVSYKDDAMKVNGLTVKKLIKEGISVKKAVNKIVSFIIKYKISTFIGHNSKVFDVPRIDYLLNRFRGVSIKEKDQEDTIIIARRKLKLRSYTLKSLCRHFGIVNKQEHSAVEDTIATIEVYKRLIL